ncbi:MAG: large repetitive protein [Bacillota bacterium]|nr:large repetitive protein [Bacillota bacterium]
MVTRKHAKWLALAVLACVLVLAASFGAPAEQKLKGAQVLPEVRTAWQEPREEFVPGEYLVRFQDGVLKEDALGVLGHAGMEVLKEIYFKPSKAFPDGLTIYHVKAAAGVRAEDAARALKADSRVKYAAPNRKLYADGPTVRAVPSDPYFNYMWGLNNTGQEFDGGLVGTPDADIDAPEAWDIRHDAPTIVVADIDTGIQWDHPDLAANIWVNPDEIPDNGVDDDGNGYIDDIYGWDFVNEDNTVYDSIDDHGTHTAGTVGAVGNNGVGVTGVAWNVKIMCLKFLEYGSGTTDDAVEAFAYAWNNGANLTTDSWGYTGPADTVLMDAMAAAEIIHVCAAGNSASDNDAGYPNYSHYPSSFPLDNVISAAASEWNDNLADFSCWGATTVDLAAPGDYILSTYPTDQTPSGYLPYAYMSGTSMATPHVAGAVAVLMAEFPDMAPYPGAPGHVPGEMTIKDLLLATVDRKPAFEGKMVSGGRLNLRNALLQAIPPIIDSVAADATYGEPPLTVSFSATAHDDGTIVDKWWDFGDGTAPVHDWNATHTYTNVGTYTATFQAVDDEGLEASASIRIAVFDESTVILVDDDGGGWERAFTDALDAAGIPWVIFTPPVPLDPTIPNIVIWTTGSAWANTLTEEDQAWLSAYLDNGGRLFLSGQDVIWDLGVNEFVRDYLHVASANEDVGTTHVYGVPGEPISDGLEIELEYPFEDYSDAITPAPDAAGIFTNDNGDFCALRYVGLEPYRVVFFAFPFEAIPASMGAAMKLQAESIAADLMTNIIEFLSETGTPIMGVAPNEFNKTVAHGAIGHDTLTITNTGESTLYFNLSSGILSQASMRPLAAHVEVEKGGPEPAGVPQTEGAGGPDGYGYIWIDSDEPGGPAFDWVDITAVGTPGPTGDDAQATVSLPFTFNFYGEPKTSVTISTNGYLTFGPYGSDYSNDPIPDDYDPNDLLAVFWDDLHTGNGATYYYYDAAANRFIVSWVGVRRYGGTSDSLNFQVILYPNGKIVYQYQTMSTSTLNSATVGIENSLGTVGLQVVYNANYVHNDLAIEFTYVPQFLTFSRQFGAVAPGESMDIDVGFDARNLAPGDYSNALKVTSNDPANNLVTIPAYLTVTPNEIPVIDYANADPVFGPPPLEVSFSASAFDPDGTIADMWWDFGDGSPVVHAANTTHVYTAEGLYEAVFHAVDDDGAEVTASVTIEVVRLPEIGWSPEALNVSAVPGSVAHRQLHVESVGTAPLRFMVGATQDFGQFYGMERTASAKTVDANAKRAVGLFEPVGQQVRELAGGDVLDMWDLSWYVNLAWGVGFDGAHVWVSDPDRLWDYSFTTDGNPTGFEFPTDWVGAWPGDFAWDGRYLWQVNVGGNNGIYKLDPATGEVLDFITDPDGIWTAISQRGLAYDPVEDVFYIGGWNQGVIYKVAGLSWLEPGKIQDTYLEEMPLPIAGIARVGWFLVITLNSSPDIVVVLDTTTDEIVEAFYHPGGGEYGGAGCEADFDGHVWMSYMGDYWSGNNANTMWLVDILGVLFDNAPAWLSSTPAEGILNPGESMDIDLAFDTNGLEQGVNYSAWILLFSNDWDTPVAGIPVTFRLDTLTAGFTWSESEPNTVAFTDTSTDADGGGVVAWSWDFGDGATSTEQNPVHRYAANGHYHVKLTVTDADGAVACAEQAIVLSNLAPVADFSFSEIDPLTVQFADASVDLDGTVVTWSWDFGDGAPVSDSRNPVHTYTAGGSYEVTLVVTDNDGASASITKTVEVNALPVVKVTSPAEGDLWIGVREITWTATDADDAEEDLEIKLEYSGDAGATWKLIAEGEANDGSYTWDTSKVGRGGKYLVKVTATDPDGGVGEGRSGEFTIVVLSRTVVAAPNPASGCVTFYYSIGSNGTLYIYDIAGRLVHSAELSSEANAYEWDLTSGGRPLANGLYLYLVVTEDGEKSEVGRLVISH